MSNKTWYHKTQFIDGQQFNTEGIQALATFFGGGGKYINPVELSGLTSDNCGDGY